MDRRMRTRTRTPAARGPPLRPCTNPRGRTLRTTGLRRILRTTGQHRTLRSTRLRLTLHPYAGDGARRLPDISTRGRTRLFTN
jgi:hypothetical protein